MRVCSIEGCNEKHVGLGTILAQEYTKGSLAERYSVKLDDCPNVFQYTHEKHGGVYFWKSEIEVVKELL